MSTSRSGFHASSLLVAWLVGSVLVAAGLILFTTLAVEGDPFQALLVGLAIFLPLTLLYSLPFMLLLGIPGGLYLARRPRGFGATVATALAASLVVSAALGAIAWAIGDWSLAATGAAAAPVYGLLAGVLIARRRPR